MVQSTVWITTALLSSLACEAFHVPFFNHIEEASAHLLSAIHSESESGDVGTEESPSTTQTEQIDSRWACDVRSWVRAPDLRPGTVIPAEARLAVNGTACGDIFGWDVGLRFKERAIAKIRSNDTELPKRPVHPSVNESMWEELDGQRDWNDIYFVGGPFRSPTQEYEDKLEEYNLAMKNQSLWSVRASERIVFDLTQQMPFEPITWDIDAAEASEFVSEKPLGVDRIARGSASESGLLAAVESQKLDPKASSQVQSFFVHVPSTNFPPIMSDHWNGMDQGQDEQMINTETLLEYYHLVHLKNGTTLDIPAGTAGFLPDPTPWKAGGAPIQAEKTGWPAMVELQSPRLEDYPPDQPWRRYDMETPECEKDNLAEFQVEVIADDASFVQGQNVTLNVTLTRTGNGSEYPTFIDARLLTARNVTWVYNFITTEEQYRSLVEPSSSGRTRRLSGPGQGKHLKVLQIPSDQELERRRKEMEDSERGVYFTMNGGWGGRWPLRPEEMGTRYDIEADQELGKEIYHFQVYVPISANEFPNFVTTFQSLQPVIKFDLHTTFLCEPDQPYFDDAFDDDDGSEEQGEDKEWSEFSLPYRKKDEKKFRTGRSLVHHGSVPVHIATSYNHSRSKASGLVHYLDDRARAPVLLLTDTPSTSHVKVNQLLTEETAEQLRKTRYHDRGRHGYEPDLRNPGGRWMHAASLWQRKEYSGNGKNGDVQERGSGVDLEVLGNADGDERQFVVQQ
ncbi:hypothetical protein IAU59_004863 [Kwoniella sp. CBS 9459]